MNAEEARLALAAVRSIPKPTHDELAKKQSLHNQKMTSKKILSIDLDIQNAIIKHRMDHTYVYIPEGIDVLNGVKHHYESKDFQCRPGKDIMGLVNMRISWRESDVSSSSDED